MVLAVLLQGKSLVDRFRASGVAFAGAIVVLVAFTLLAHYVASRVGPLVDPSDAGKPGKPRRRGISSLWVGKDRRVSTSKLQVVLWTYAVAFGLISLALYGLFDTLNEEAFALDDQYLILLGSPAAAAILAKASTATKVQNGLVGKTTKEGKVRVAEGAAETVCDDSGQIDPFDFQYFLFTLVALGYFLAHLLGETLKDGLPQLPGTLVALTGVSAAGYAAKKALEREVPVVTGIHPAAAATKETVVVRGKNLVPPGAGEALVRERTDQNQDRADQDRAQPTVPVIMFGGLKGDDVHEVPGGFAATVPLGLKAGKEVAVSFVRVDGVTAEDFPFRVIAGGPRAVSVNQERLVIGRDERVVIFGFGFGSGGKVTLGERELRVEGDDNWKENRIRARLPDDVEHARRIGLEVPGDARLVVLDRRGRKSKAIELNLVKAE